MKRRTFLASTSKAGLATALSIPLLHTACSNSRSNSTATPKLYAATPGFAQAPLPYAYNALQPSIDAATMEIHYTKHAAAYTKNMQEALQQEMPNAKSLEQVFASMSSLSSKLRNNAGGHYNHESFWRWMTPNGKAPSPAMLQLIETNFTSMADFKTKFTNAAVQRFGSGWAWLVLDANKKLQIGSTPNQDNPLMDNADVKGYPLLGVDVWEHAYYLKYQNKRADYLAAWWEVVNWNEVEARYQFAVNS